MSFKPWKPLLLTALVVGAGTTAATAQKVAAAQKAIELERYNEARADLAGDNSPEASFEMGRIYQMRDKPDSAATAFNKAAGTTPFGMVAAGRALLAKNDVAGADAKFADAAKATKMKDVRILTLITQAYAESDNKSVVDKAIPYVKAAETASKGKDNPALMIARGDLYQLSESGGGEAMSSYDRAIAADANNAEAYYRRGALNVRSRNGSEALTNLNKAIELNPNYAPAYKELAEMYFAAGQYDKATSTFQTFMDKAEKSPNTDAEYAAFLYLSKKYPEALTQIDKVLAADPSNLTMNRLKAYTLYETGDYAGAATAMDSYMKMAPAEKIIPEDYSYQSKILLKNKRPADAIAVLQKSIAVTTDPAKKRDLMNDLAVAQSATGDYKGAVSTQKQITSMPGSDLTDQFRYAVALTKNQDYQRADSVYNIINTAKPDYVPAYQYRAQANAGLDPETTKGTAKPYYEKYIQMASATPDKYKSGLVESYDYLALYNLNAKNKAEASSYVEKALALDPTDERAITIKKNLAPPAPRRAAPATKRK
ncbi:tetratricopeptide repeat protein [Hymenobacter sp. RP-2-7]|uniref:Tetratricopeptide repeat protein n=1 Tax=Hymenobacter polaris TaxID=2682546 RepID=A0A7Y0AEI1_9BACT|nr:tetratricopeptide repeat protein [Hymenobacter polaris]NML65859.1 tetratricopeptide repeat protein [Hymenobacter polaris]